MSEPSDKIESYTWQIVHLRDSTEGEGYGHIRRMRVLDGWLYQEGYDQPAGGDKPATIYWYGMRFAPDRPPLEINFARQDAKNEIIEVARAFDMRLRELQQQINDLAMRLVDAVEPHDEYNATMQDRPTLRERVGLRVARSIERAREAITIFRGML